MNRDEYMANRYCFAFLLSCLAIATTSSAEDVDIRLVAGDRADTPLVSDLVDFRRSPDGGLIAVQWLSQMKLAERPLFPIMGGDKDTPKAPSLANADKKPVLDDLDDLLNDINQSQKKKPKPRPVDQVDELYRDKAFSDRPHVGPTRSRRSVVSASVTRNSLITPGDIEVSARSKSMTVVCFPLTITARRAGELIAFNPQLRHGQRDLLADCLFEHSPDLPLGDDSPQARNGVEGHLGWLQATQGGARRFRKLTLYLPADSGYQLQGQKFDLRREGVILKPGDGRIQLEQKSPFHLELIYPPDQASDTPLPLLSDLQGDWAADSTTLTLNQSTGVIRPMRFRSAKHGVRTLQARSPAAMEGEPAYVLALSQNDKAESPIVRLISPPTAGDTSGGTLRIQVTETTDLGATTLPINFGGVLTRVNFRRSDARRSPMQAEENQTSLSFTRTAPDTWESPLEAIPAGLYGLQLSLKPISRQWLPMVIGSASTTAAVSLYTYHNRCDYRRGETVHLGVQMRSRAPIKNAKFQLTARSEAGEVVAQVPIEFSCDPGESPTQFIPLSTANLPLGRISVSLADVSTQPGAVLTYDTWFTLFAAEPESTFARYAWMTNSFSGPIKAGEKRLVNLVIGQRPSAFLPPNDLQQLTLQPAFPADLQQAMLADPLFPAPHTATAYDEETEKEAAIAMRLGMQYCPNYGWGMNSQEAAWNPKHTLPVELDRVRRLSAQVTQRHRDFGNFAGLHFNWYPRLGGNWEAHPVTDGNAGPRREMLAAQTQEVYAETPADKAASDGGLVRAVRAHKYRVGAFSRAYDAWTEKSRTLTSGIGDPPQLPTFEEPQPGLTGQPVYTSLPPVSWFQQRNYYPTSFHRTLPVAAVHAYTDFGFSPFQPLWALDQWTAGIDSKPRWVTTMSNGRDIMLRHALLLAGRGASGIDINGQDPVAAGVISDFLKAYGPFFRTQQPASDVAIITSLRQQFSTKSLIGQWMGYTGGSYYALYNQLWYARRPPAMLPEEEVTLEELQKYQAVFLIGQQVPYPAKTQAALTAFEKQGGRIFKDDATAITFPGESFTLKPNESSKWDASAYNQNRDRFFVGVQAGYEGLSEPLAALLAKLPPPHVAAPTHDTMLATLKPQPQPIDEPSGPRIVSTVFAVNDRHPMPGVLHPWNFWSATIMANESELSFDEPYILYDLLEGGRAISLQRGDDGRYHTPVEFSRCSGRAYVVTSSPISAASVNIVWSSQGGPLQIKADVRATQGQRFAGAWPFEITLFDPSGKSVQTIYRALGGDRRTTLTIPSAGIDGDWRVQARELVAGHVATAIISNKTSVSPAKVASSVIVPRPNEIAEFLAAADRPLRLLIDQRQIDFYGKDLRRVIEAIQAQAKSAGRTVEVTTADSLSVIETPQRWRPNERDRTYLKQAKQGEAILVAASLNPTYERSTDGRSGALEPAHPASGWQEPGAKHRIYSDVILIGQPGRNRFLADLHATVGMRLDEGFLGDSSALVQVIHEAFTPRHACLSIQANDLAGLLAGVDRAFNVHSQTPPEQPELDELSQGVAAEKIPPANPIQDVFGAAVHPIAFLENGDLFVSAGTQATNYFVLSSEGKVQKTWLGKYAVELDQRADGDLQGMWIRDWWGVPGFVNTIVRADRDAKPLWWMRQPGYARSYSGWRHPGKRSLLHRQSGDLLVAGNGRLSRVSPSGKVIWQYDDLQTCNDVESFRFARDLMIHDISPDGSRLLVAAFGIEPYANFVAKFVRPTVFLIDTATGKAVWEKPDVLIDHSACGFAGDDSIVLADATPGRKRVTLLDMNGKERWSLRREAGTSAAKLSPDNSWLIVRPEAPRGANYQTLGPAVGLRSIPLADPAAARDFDLSAPLHDWRLIASSGRVLVSTTDGRLGCYDPDTSLVWEKQFSGPCRILVSPSGDRIAVGAATGRVLLLSGDGQLEQEIDLMPHNMVRDEAAYVAAYTASPVNAPIRDPRMAMSQTLAEQHGKHIRFSPNLLSDHTQAITSLEDSQQYQVPEAKAGVYLFTLNLRGSSKVQVTVHASAKDPIYSTMVAGSGNWDQRTFSWKLAEPGPMVITVQQQGDQPAQVRAPHLATMKFPSTNICRQKVLEGPDLATTGPGDDLESLLGDGEKLTPPKVRFFLPNDIDLTARSRGAPPFTPVVPFTTPFDGVLSGKTSWLNRPLGGSSHAQLQLTFNTPVKLAALAVYEHPDEPFTSDFALFCRRADTQQWIKAGHVRDNQNPYNLFTLEPIAIDAVTYLWLKSADGHARIAEIEGYRALSLPGLEP